MQHLAGYHLRAYHFAQYHLAGQAGGTPPAPTGNSNYVGNNYGYGYPRRRPQSSSLAWAFQGSHIIKLKPELVDDKPVAPEIIAAPAALLELEGEIDALQAKIDGLDALIAQATEAQERIEAERNAKALQRKLKKAYALEQQLIADAVAENIARLQRDEEEVELLLMAIA